MDSRVERFELTSRLIVCSGAKVIRCMGRGLLLFAFNVKALVGAGVQDEADGISETFST